jgi:hypothetical protein
MCQDTCRTLRCWLGLLGVLAVFFIVFTAFDLVSSGVSGVYNFDWPEIVSQSSYILKKYLKVEL